MPNQFVFIIPLTPSSRLTDSRAFLRTLCLETLASQDYRSWKAILVGTPGGQLPASENFIHLGYEGPKEEKIQVATQYIIEHEIPADYLVRLDDDDIFNPGLLNAISSLDFDLYVDKYHAFWDPLSGMISQQVMYWFPNTCILKKEHALKVYGPFPSGDYKRMKPAPLLIENEHSDFHVYFNNSHRIFFAGKSNPVYVRTLNPDSITSLQSGNHHDYLARYGNWKKNRLKAFSFLNDHRFPGQHPVKTSKSMVAKARTWIQNIQALKNYRSIVIGKK